MTRLKLADLTSGIGGLVRGVGLGAMFTQWFTPAAVTRRRVGRRHRTFDAIRALSGVVRDADESIAMTNASHGIEPSLIGAGVRESVHP